MTGQRIELTPDEVASALQMAEVTYQRHERKRGHFGNSLRRHEVGKLGETAVEKWLRSNGRSPDSAFRDVDREGESDLLLDGRGIEVKSWSPEWWDEGGRCVTPRQLGYIRRNSEAIVWTIVKVDGDPQRVELMGWSTPDDVASTALRVTGPPWNRVENHQIDIDDLRPLDELIGSLHA